MKQEARNTLRSVVRYGAIVALTAYLLIRGVFLFFQGFFYAIDSEGDMALAYIDVFAGIIMFFLGIVFAGSLLRSLVIMVSERFFSEEEM